MASRLLLALFLSLLASSALGRPDHHQQSPYQLSQAQQCRLQRLTTSQPSQRIESEGGLIELWDENEDQFQCAGVAPTRTTQRPNTLALPQFHPTPRLVYVVQGQGVLGVTFPGCAETFHSHRQEQEQEQEEEGQQGQSRGDLHQKVHRIRKGDIIAIPSGLARWTFNDGNEELILITVDDLNNQANQLDQNPRVFSLAGGQNILRGFAEELLAEVLKMKREVIRAIQKEDKRGPIVNVKRGMRIVRPQEEEDEGQQEQREGSNGLEEGSFCSMKIRHNIDDPRSSDVYTKDAGRLQIVNQYKLPILQAMDMSAEKGTLFPNALYSAHWAMNGHAVVYVTRGEAQVEVVDNRGERLMNDRVNKGDMFVVPQFYVASFKAGNQGIEWVTIKTTNTPMRSPVAGYTSVFRGLPNQVISKSYDVSPGQAEALKYNSGHETFLVSPKRRTD